jgi:hypothetical protein
MIDTSENRIYTPATRFRDRTGGIGVDKFYAELSDGHYAHMKRDGSSQLHHRAA